MADEAPKEPDEEFDKFKELTRRLLTVSKEDLKLRSKTEPDSPPRGGYRIRST